LHAAVDRDKHKVRLRLIVCRLLQLALRVVRAFEFTVLNVRWDEGAYGSAVWVLLGFRTVNLATDFADTLVLTAVMYKEPIEGKRYVDIAENSGYWDFIVRRQRNRRQRNRRQRNRPKSGVILRGRRLMP